MIDDAPPGAPGRAEPNEVPEPEPETGGTPQAAAITVRSAMSGTKRGADQSKARTGPQFGIRAAAERTGVPAETIRNWERRYTALSPARTSAGTRLYSEADLERLSLLSRLVGLGEKIATIASVSDEDLRTRLESLWGQSPDRASGSQDDALASTTKKSSSNFGGIRVRAYDSRIAPDVAIPDTCFGPVEILTADGGFVPIPSADALGDVDIVAVHLDQLGEAPVELLGEFVREYPNLGLVVRYDYARVELELAMMRVGVRLVAGVPRAAELSQLFESMIALRDRHRQLGLAAPEGEVPAPVFSPAQITKIVDAKVSTDCECPNHIATIIMRMLGFEAYSRSCEIASPDEAELHGLLARGTGRARAHMEALLETLLRHEAGG